MAASDGNKYLQGLPPRRATGTLRGMLVAWVALAVLVFVLFDCFSGQPHLLVDLGLLVVGLLLTLMARRERRRAEVPAAEMQEAEHALLRDEHGRAVQVLRAFLGRPTTPLRRANALLLLGRSAEAVGDFEDAAGVYAEALAALPSQRGLAGMAYDQVAPVVAARRAFVLAAAGRLDEAAAQLGGARHRDAFPGARTLAVRAEAVLAARRGEAQAVIDLLSRERVLLANTLVHRDKVLLRVLEAWAKGRVAGAFRAAPLLGVGADAELSPWLGRVAPQAAEVLGAPVPS